ncbi:MAG TPA: EamA family transporter [bacterium]|nr:EamA family transporter [bacterium]
MKSWLLSVLGGVAGAGRAKDLLLIVFSVTLGVGGQIALKYGVGHASKDSSSRIAQSLDPRSVFAFLQSAATNKFVLLGFLLYLISAASWLVILSRVDLSFAYPLISISYIIIVVLSRFIFNEPVTSYRIAGTIVVCAGVFLLLRS